MTAPGFRVDLDGLRGHAASVGDTQGQVAEAADAGHHVAGLDDAYGLLCLQMGLPFLLRGPQERVAGLIDKISKRLDEHSGKLKDAADKYSETEKQVCDILQRLATDLESAKTGPTLGGN